MKTTIATFPIATTDEFYTVGVLAGRFYVDFYDGEKMTENVENSRDAVKAVGMAARFALARQQVVLFTWEPMIWKD